MEVKKCKCLIVNSISLKLLNQIHCTQIKIHSSGCLNSCWAAVQRQLTAKLLLKITLTKTNRHLNLGALGPNFKWPTGLKDQDCINNLSLFFIDGSRVLPQSVFTDQSCINVLLFLIPYCPSTFHCIASSFHFLVSYSEIKKFLQTSLSVLSTSSLHAWPFYKCFCFQIDHCICVKFTNVFVSKCAIFLKL